MFYKEGNDVMCFMRSSDIPNAPTNHWFHLRIVCMFQDIAYCFLRLFSFEPSKRREELLVDDY